MNDYTKYFSDDDPADSLIAYAMITPKEFRSSGDETEYLKQTRPILRDELYTCYEFLDSKGLLKDFKIYRG